jgi:uncharacterized membrane-anchored protein YitT (DUF2179 family)
MTPDLASPSHHKWYEDIFAIFIGTTLVSLGIAFYGEAQLATGSTAGLALLIQYVTGIPFGWLFFAINLPFYLLALLRMGWPFAIKTMASVAIVSLFRHKASVGGINILALFLQDNFGIRAGYFQLGVDAVILVAAFFILPFDRVLYSILGALVLNMIIALNHRRDRYVGFS